MSDQPPERIWLQGDGLDGTYYETWCQDKINDTDTEYVRGDIHQAELERLKKKLEIAKTLVIGPLDDLPPRGEARDADSSGVL